MNRIFRDAMYRDSGGGVMHKSDKYESKELLLKIIMEKCKISESDLEDISIVKRKLREENINDILNES